MYTWNLSQVVFSLRWRDKKTSIAIQLTQKELFLPPDYNYTRAMHINNCTRARCSLEPEAKLELV